MTDALPSASSRTLSFNSRMDGAVGGHSRLVLLWQNNDKDDLFCTEEITQLQVLYSCALMKFIASSGAVDGKRS